MLMKTNFNGRARNAKDACWNPRKRLDKPSEALKRSRNPGNVTKRRGLNESGGHLPPKNRLKARRTKSNRSESIAYGVGTNIPLSAAKN